MAVVNRETKPAGRHNTDGKASGGGWLHVVSLALAALACVGMMVSIWAIFLYAPTDAIEGDAQRIFYFHVPVAIIALLSSGVVAVASIVYLWRRDERWDWAARAAAEVGAVFITLALVTGSLWGRATWGTWWTWDARLTTTLVLWFIDIAYLMLRSYMGRTPASARLGAVLAIVGVIDVPIIYESVNWWRTLHPQPELGTPGALPPGVVLVFMLAMATLTLLYSVLVIQVYQLGKMQTLAQRLRAGVE